MGLAKNAYQGTHTHTHRSIRTHNVAGKRRGQVYK